MGGFEESFDVVVVGSGGGALVGAIAAADHGLRTLLVEKAEYFGGVTAYSGAGFQIPMSPVAERQGITEPIEEPLAHLAAVVEPEWSSTETRRTYLETGPKMVAWLEQFDPIDLVLLPFQDYYDTGHDLAVGRIVMPAPTNYEDVADVIETVRPPLLLDRTGTPRPKTGPLWPGNALIARLVKTAQGFDNLELRRNCPMTDLIVNDGAVVGVVVNQDGQERRIGAGGVIIAAGGFERNQQLRDRFHVRGRAAWSAAREGTSTGDWVEPALRAGAALGNMENMWKSPGVRLSDDLIMPGFIPSGGVMVNSRGERFMNEAQAYDRAGFGIADDMDSGADDQHWLIYDSRWQTPPIAMPLVSDYDSYVASGYWKKADTLPELVAQLGLPTDRTLATIEQYNQYCADGKDPDFHRGEELFDQFFARDHDAGPVRAMPPIDQGPFWAMPIYLGDLGTKGGMVTNDDAQVLTVDGEPIPGLYAAGNSMAAFTGPYYPSGGYPIGTCMVFAYRAAAHLANSQ